MNYVLRCFTFLITLTTFYVLCSPRPASATGTPSSLQFGIISTDGYREITLDNVDAELKAHHQLQSVPDDAPS